MNNYKSSCNYKSNRILIDCDGVLTNQLEVLKHLFNKEYSIKIADESIVDYDMKTWHPEIEQYMIESLLRKPEFYLAQELIPGAVEALHILKANNWQPIIVTAVVHPGYRWQQLHNVGITRHFPINFADAMRTKDYFARKYNIDIFVEDSPKEVQSLAKDCKEGWLIETLYNNNIVVPFNVKKSDSLLSIAHYLKPYEGEAPEYLNLGTIEGEGLYQ